MATNTNAIFTNGLEPELAEAYIQLHQDEVQALQQVNRKLDMMRTMVHGVCRGDFQGFIVQGEKGLGKSHVVHQVLDEYDATVAGNEDLPEEKRRDIRRFTGKITPLQLFLALQEWNTSKAILLFDDCDSAWNEIDALNVLKAAMDTKDRRIVTWATSSKRVQEQSFEFKGQIIVITNAGLQSKHYKAFLDRVHTFPLHMTQIQKMAKIKEIASLDTRLDAHLRQEILMHIESHLDTIGPRLSMRIYEKVVKLAKLDIWKELAVETVYQEME